MFRLTWLLLLLVRPAPGYENLIENGDFSELLPGVAVPSQWHTNIHTKEGAAGKVAFEGGVLKITDQSDNAAWVRTSQMPVSARAEHLYRFACDVRGSARVLLIIYEFRKGNKPYLTHNLGSFVPGESWRRTSGLFRTGPDVDTLKVSLIADQKGEAWFDNVELWDLGERPSAIVPAAPAEARLFPFFLLDGKGKELVEPTEAFISYDSAGLKVRYECKESQVDKVKAVAATDGMGVFADDCVEIFLSPGGPLNNYYQIGVNTKGVRGFVGHARQLSFFQNWYGSARAAPARKWAPDIPVRSKIKKDGWEVRVDIPWKSIGISPHPGLELRANFTRRRMLGGEQNASWALMAGDTFHDPSQWGHLILAADPTKVWGRVVETPRQEKAVSVPIDTSTKPGFAVRAFHSQAPVRNQLEAYRKLVRTLARLRFNTLMMEVNDRLQYERHPEIGHSQALSKREMKELVDYCRGLGFEVIPQVQTFGHFNYVLRHDKYRALSENAKPNKRLGFWNYCPSNPDTYKLVFDLFEEVIEVFRPKQFHIGHDEITFTPIGVCDRCKGNPGQELFAKDVLKLHDWLKKRGIEMLMWGDHLLAEHNGRPPYNTAKAIEKLPRDIIICDWHYNAAEDFPSVRFFKEQGFRVLACGWFQPRNIANFAQVAAAAKAEGYCMTTWCGVNNIERMGRIEAAVVLSSEFAWSPGGTRLEALPWHPAQAFRLIHFGPRSGGRYRALDLSGQASKPLEETALGAVLPAKIAANGVPFEISSNVVYLDAKHPKAWQVPVGGKLTSLHFLHCTTKPPQEVDHLYDRHHVLPGLVGFVRIYFGDGTEVQNRLSYRRNITQWNSKMGAGECDLAWQGHRRDGALVTLCSWEWRNPYPGKQISGIDLIRASDKVELMFVAVSAQEELTK